ncbi:SDR family NAD(P)-dependent oxidoreductase [Aliirhizobium cellulosilyticum]|uniref:NAD(P)-dependent dehydrogenase (Short-subunit alcohol dehydrogenase family) n=1 Tax=Aliirhizobium cellulosilyticum TaxID=393664 RepID=A0A7W6WMK0_9HYPH|nr:SDR family NAD(P)-dependent oxidoreductase [Rhizobium cellulosilyticum]MBB4346307.1 NAD(P)-dependent dehydrogenase (short-subunit alcohol dehydrogenase family) [Rhizobium cellulosilyticum]MBB4411299.1 NAD(P)-dependent dehydrogenase (short-subunit alcohol dehydrogenase family) [Rhizobium cellulosilyticum]MBB4445988.1 NAD(P)-dependent dehydrogenase (short-subunit alcohol dehydrogenase family) [Rhizobium cellulosilyticum]
MTVSNRVAMISGASRGIGASIAEKLLSEGWAVSLGVRSPEASAFKDNANALVCRFDALDPESERSWMKETIARFGRLDGLVHNAGIMTPKTVLEAGDDDFDLIFNVNVKSPMRLSQLAWPHLEKAPNGRIVTLASLSGKRVKSAGSGLYAMSKFAAVALGHGLRQCGKENGVRSTIICPSFVATDMGNALASRDSSELTQPEDIAKIVHMVLELPKTASIAEIPVHYTVEDCY